MNTKKKPRQKGTGTAQNKTQHDDFTRLSDPLQGWHALAKPARQRQQKKSWMRRKGGAA